MNGSLAKAVVVLGEFAFRASIVYKCPDVHTTECSLQCHPGGIFYGHAASDGEVDCMALRLNIVGCLDLLCTALQLGLRDTRKMLRPAFEVHATWFEIYECGKGDTCFCN